MITKDIARTCSFRSITIGKADRHPPSLERQSTTREDVLGH
jgi:hypothetical protein